jgi:hypothetical protein
MEEVRKTPAVQFKRSPFSASLPALGLRAHEPPGRAVGVVLLLALVAMIAFAACSTDRQDKKKLLQRVPPPQPLLSARASYAEGALAVQAWLGSSVRMRKAAAQPGTSETGPGAGGRQSNAVGSSSQSKTSLDRANTPFEEGANAYSAEEIDRMYGRENYQYIMPPRLALIVSFVNTSSQKVSLTIAEVSSLLGSFAPIPETFTLAPGQEGSTEPMLSALDNNFDELDVTLTLKSGLNRETQVLKLRRVPSSPPTATGNLPPP